MVGGRGIGHHCRLFGRQPVLLELGELGVVVLPSLSASFYGVIIALRQAALGTVGRLRRGRRFRLQWSGR